MIMATCNKNSTAVLHTNKWMPHELWLMSEKCWHCGIFFGGGNFQKKSNIWEIESCRVESLLCLSHFFLLSFLFQCRVCTKCFVEKSGLRAHLLTHCPINKECPQCGKMFKTERTMTRHLRTHLNLTYTCEICNKQFRHEESLRVHKSVHKEGGKSKS